MSQLALFLGQEGVLAVLELGDAEVFAFDVPAELHIRCLELLELVE